MPPRLRRSTFQILSLLSLALPIGATYALAPRAVARVGATDSALEVRVLVTVLVLLVAVLLWAALLLPLRAMTDMAKLSDELARLRAEGVRTAIQREQSELARLERSPRLADRRRYHLMMAAAAGVVALAAGFLTWLTLAGEGDVLFLSLPVAALVGLALALHHLVRWKQDRG